MELSICGWCYPVRGVDHRDDETISRREEEEEGEEEGEEEEEKGSDDTPWFSRKDVAIMR